MTTNLNDVNTDSRGEMVCPHCWTKGLVESDSYAAQCDDDPKEKIIYATACPNGDCPHNDGGRANPGRVPPDALKKQYSSNTFGGVISLFSTPRALFSNPRVTGALTVVVMLVAALVMLGPIFGGGGGTAAAEYSNVTESTDGNYSSWTEGNWTIAETNDGYVVSGYVDNDIVYLNGDGNTVDDPVAFNTVPEAEEAISNFESQSDRNISDPEPTDWGAESNWSVYQFGNYSVAAGQVNGTTVYLNYTNGSDNVTVSTDPTLYNTTEAAYDAIIEYETATTDDNLTVNSTTAGDVQESLQEEDPLNDGSETQTEDSSNTTDTPTYTYTSCCDDDDGSVSGTEEEGSGEGSTVRGSVNDNEGEPVEGATVHMYSDHYTTTTDENGEYVFDNIPAGEHHLHIEPPENTTLASTANVSFELDSNGNLTILNETDSSTVLRVDGEIVENRIGFNLPSESPIEVTGTGRDIATEVHFDNSRNADDIAVTLSPEYTAGIAETDINSTSGSGTVYIGGNTNPENSNLSLQGTPGTEFFTVNGTGQGTVVINGNLQTASQEVILSGRETISNRTVSGIGNDPLENNGNVDSNLTLSLSGGDEQRNSRTASGTGDGSIENNGNVEADATLTVEGSTNTVSESSSGAINDGEATTINVSGTTSAQNVELTLTGREIIGDAHSSDTNTYEYQYLGICGNNEMYGSASNDIPMPDTNEMYVDYSLDFYRGEAGCMYGGAYVYTGFYDDANNQIYSNGISEAGSFVDSGSFTTDGPVTIETNGESDGPEAQVTVDYTAHPVYPPGDVRVYVDGVQVSEQNLNDGETTTIDLGSLEPGEHQISIVSTGGGGVDYTAQWDAVYESENIEIDTNGDEQADFTHSGPLGTGETAQTTVPLDVGTNNIDVTSDGPTPSWEASFDELTATANISADVNGDGTADITHSAPLRSTESVTEVVEVPPGETNVSIDSTGPTPTWDGTLAQANQTEDPTLVIENESYNVSHSGPLGPNEEANVEIAPLNPGERSVTTDAAVGPAPEYQVAYVGQANPESATVLINGNTYEYPADFDDSGPINGITENIPVDGLTIGENDVTVSTAEVDGILPEVTATVKHPSEALQTSEPTIYVTNPSGDIHSQNISDAYITDGQLTENATVELPESWFENGRNVVVVRTGDSSVVSATVTGTSRTTQVSTFQASNNLNVTSLP